jgi:hypothetical protein
MAAPIWLTPPGDLGIIPEQEYYEFFFDAYNPGGGSLTYSLISGALPVGLEVKPNGTMFGIPSGKVGGVPAAVDKVTTSEFTLRIKNSNNLVADRTFTITIAGILPQTIIPDVTSLGTYVDGTYVYVDINTIEPNPLLESKFSVISGELPSGLSLDPITGVIKGYLTPFVSSQDQNLQNFDVAPWDIYGFDFTGVSTSKNYQFTIKADNGITIETKVYTIFVFAINSLTADTDLITADNQGLITADTAGPFHTPVILTEEGTVGIIRQGSRADIQIVGKDFDGDNINFGLVDPTSLPPGLSLIADSGWIVGDIPFGILGTTTYNFQIYVYKTASPEYESDPKTFTIQILGQVDDIVEWHTDSDLGTLRIGEISELFVSATTPSNRVLNYRLENSAGTLPYGLKLTDDGLLSGRVSFETFRLDSGTTTFDENITTFDRKFTFTIAAYDLLGLVYSTKTFTVSIIADSTRPYENLYIQVLPEREQRDLYASVINNVDIFPENYLYRSSDPWFGKNTMRRSLFLSGLNPEQVSNYISAMTLNHYWKNLYFGQVKTAQALDDNFNVRYEVVYLEILDRGVNADGLGPNLSVSLPSNSRNISTIYPNSFPNMAERVADGIGYQNRGILPDWMTSRQTDGTVLGFTRALVLCYTKPGKSKEIAYRVKLVQNTFQYVDFVIDRYEWDNSLSRSFDKSANTFIVNNFAYATGTINSNVTSNIITGLTLTVIGQGTISGSFGNATIVGSGTSFNTQLRVGRPMYRTDTNVTIGNISRILSSNILVLDEPLNTTISSVGYSAIVNSTKFTEELFVGDTIVVDSGVRLGTVKTITSDSNLTLYANSLSTVSNVAFQHTERDSYSTPGKGDKYLKYPQVGVIK